MRVKSALKNIFAICKKKTNIFGQNRFTLFIYIFSRYPFYSIILSLFKLSLHSSFLHDINLPFYLLYFSLLIFVSS
ncbi:hypothetical protein DTX79_19295, partial [Bacilli bacterium]